MPRLRHIQQAGSFEGPVKWLSSSRLVSHSAVATFRRARRPSAFGQAFSMSSASPSASTSTVSDGQPRRRVAIVGAGPAGLAMASELLAVSSSFQPVLFERRSKLGGLWNYHADPGDCQFQFDRCGKAYPLWRGKGKDGDAEGTFVPPGAMYEGLRTNLPCDLMAYRGVPFDQTSDLFPSRADVETYIEAFADRKQLTRFVRFGTGVVSVKRVRHDPSSASWGGGSVWQVVSRPVDGSGPTMTEDFDYVVAASGRCNTPSVPYIEGLWNFPGELIHSAWYRYPQRFRGKTVLVIGNSSSGSDIARELVGYLVRHFEGSRQWAEQSQTLPPQTGVRVYHSYHDVQKPPALDYDPREESSPSWAKRINVVDQISKIEPPTEETKKGRIILEDGNVLTDVDVIVFGTGYAFDLPFLPQTCEPFLSHPILAPLPQQDSIPSSDTLAAYLAMHQSGRPYTPPFPLAPFLTNLDDWMLLHVTDPSFAMLCTPIRLVPLPFAEQQARVVAAFWSGQLEERFRYGLPRLDRRTVSTDPAHWESWIADRTNQAATTTAVPAGHPAKDETNRTAALGYPADSAYQNGLSRTLSPRLRPKGSDQDRPVTGFRGVDPVEASISPDPRAAIFDKGKVAELAPVDATDEGWEKVSLWRNQRRETTKRLRRELLGY